MNRTIDQILEEIAAIDPALGARSDLRPLVEALLAAEPDAAVDRQFARALRDELLARSAPLPSPAPHHDFSWWLMRLAPVSVVALLLIIILPKQPGLPSGEPAADLAPEAGTFMAPPGPSLKSSPGAEDRAGIMQLRVASSAIFVPDQEPGSSIRVGFVELERPGFVVVRTAIESGTTLGTSRTLPAGRTEDFAISLSRPTAAGETLYAMLVADEDGDGAYDPSKDGPVLDPISVEPMHAVFTISTGAGELPSAAI